MPVFGNKYALGNNGGRPAHYETPESLRDACIAFFDHCFDQKEKATVTGLTLFLGFSSRSSLDDYEKRSDEFSYIIKRAKLAVENSYEQSGQTIDIFALKNMGWKDKSEIDHRTPDGVTVVYKQQEGNKPLPDAD
jgi:hypothetical protein